MTREEAIKAFEEIKASAQNNLGAKYARGCEGHYRNRIELADAALEVLRPVSREQVEKLWPGCGLCEGAKYVSGSASAVKPYDGQEEDEIETYVDEDFDFCPGCGRPMTDGAVKMVMERLEALRDEKETG